MAQLSTNRYPARNVPKVPDTRKPKARPKPANDNRPRPANDNIPRPALPPGTGRLLRIALRATRLARLSGPIAMVAGTVLDELIQGKLDFLTPTANEGFRVPGNWRIRTYCPKYPGGISGVGAWVYTSGIPPFGSPCIGDQSTTKWNTFAETQPRSNVGYGRKNGVGVLSERVNFSHSWTAIGAASAPYPELVPLLVPDALPWPEVVPLPRPDQWPVGLPMPAVNPAARGLAGRTAATPEGRATDRGSPRRRPAQGPRTANPRKPPKGTKETKKTPRGGLAGAVMAGMGKGLSSYSELGDFVESLHEALPKDLQKGKNLGEKMRDLYTHLNKIDWEKAVVNLAKNQLEDLVVGSAIGQVTGKNGLGSHLGNNAVAGPRVRY